MPASATSQRLVLMGAVLGAHGIKGEVKVKSFAAKPAAIAEYGPLTDPKRKRTFELSIVGTADAAKGILIARMAGITDRNAAEALKGVELFVDRGRLPAPEDPEEYYLADLIGLSAFDGKGEKLGEIVSVDNYGAGDLLLVVPESGEGFVVPFTKAFVPVVDIKGGRVVLDLPADFFEVPEHEEEEAAELQEAAP
ncbi:ribosome maturation factor RimM [Dongia deserti]|uniref:ribosome maturation factor RimM n=1 Tax=Dongia deserti TaxID=2268030 RepID=UPI000E64B865|nr:ribosome maturation factor RimM [Dongia deserti]